MLEDLIGGKTKFVIEWNNIPRNILKGSTDLYKENKKKFLKGHKRKLEQMGENTTSLDRSIWYHRHCP